MLAGRFAESRNEFEVRWAWDDETLVNKPWLTRRLWIFLEDEHTSQWMLDQRVARFAYRERTHGTLRWFEFSFSATHTLTMVVHHGKAYARNVSLGLIADACEAFAEEEPPEPSQPKNDWHTLRSAFDEICSRHGVSGDPP